MSPAMFSTSSSPFPVWSCQVCWRRLVAKGWLHSTLSPAALEPRFPANKFLMPFHGEGGKEGPCCRPLEAGVALGSNSHNSERLTVSPWQFWEPLGGPTCSKGKQWWLTVLLALSLPLGCAKGNVGIWVPGSVLRCLWGMAYFGHIYLNCLSPRGIFKKQQENR